MSVFAQNNGVISLTRCANRKAGFAACFFLILMGVFSKFAAALVSIPSAVLGGMTTFLFTSVAVSGIRIISTIKFTRRSKLHIILSHSGQWLILCRSLHSYHRTCAWLWIQPCSRMVQLRVHIRRRQHGATGLFGCHLTRHADWLCDCSFHRYFLEPFLERGD
jgi:hypothetical protein